MGTPVVPATGLSSDVGMIIDAAFPNGKPEMSTTDFKRAYDITKSSLAGKPRPAKTSLDYPTWAHCLMVEWKVTCDREKKAGRPEPSQMLCPECGTAVLLDHSQNNVLTCVGGCNRAITVQTFTALFRNVKPPSKAAPINPPNSSQSYGYAQIGGGGGGGVSKISSFAATGSAKSGGGASISSSIRPGQDPVAEGIVERVPKSKKPLSSWRCWRVPDDGQPPRLKSISYEVYWPPMQPEHGTCNGRPPEEIDHRCPSWHHRCGVYSVKALGNVRRWGQWDRETTLDVGIVGEIEMWGRVLEYQDGYRSEFAYPLRLWLPEAWQKPLDHSWATPQDLADKLWEQYLVEINLSDDVYYEGKQP